jgi:hypothetical protein
MSWPLATDPVSAVELIMGIGCTIMGLSHIVRPGMWVRYFTALHAEGTNGVITRTFALELWPALIIVSLHPVWSWPGIVLTLYGWAQLLKCTVAMLVPEIGLKSLGMAQRGDNAFRGGGVMLLVIAGFSFWALLA